MARTPGVEERTRSCRNRERCHDCFTVNGLMAYIRPMPLDPALLDILVCPECKTRVRLVRDGAGLECEKCHRIYPVKDDMPVMLVDEAEAPATGR